MDVRLTDPASNYGIKVDGLSPQIKTVQAYAPPAKQFVAVEEQFNFGDPFGKEWHGMDTGMVTLKPGQSVTWHVRLSTVYSIQVTSVRRQIIRPGKVPGLMSLAANNSLNFALRPKLSQFQSAGHGIQRAEFQIVDRSPYPEAAGGQLGPIAGANSRHHIALSHRVQIIRNVRVAVAHHHIHVFAAERRFHMFESQGPVEFNRERNSVAMKHRSVKQLNAELQAAYQPPAEP